MNNQAQVKHTPGPWKLVPIDSERPKYIGFKIQPDSDVWGEYKGAICTTEASYCDSNGYTKEIRANANLIAAAPELFAALKRIHKYQTNSEYRFICDDQAKAFTEDCTFMELMMEHAEVAIAKAEGRA